MLPRSDRLVQQLATLERRTARGGKDSIDHPPGGHDDIANAIAGAALLARKPAYDSSMSWVFGPDRDSNPAANDWQRQQRNLYIASGSGTRPKWS